MEEFQMKWVLRIVGGIAAILLLAVGVLFAMGFRSDVGRIHASTEISASREQVWAWINDPDKMKQWISWLVEVRTDPSHPEGVGAKRVLVMKDENNGGQLMEIQSTCREYNPPERISAQLSVAGAFDGDGTYSLVDLGNDRTRLQIESRYTFGSGFARLMEPLISHLAKKKMEMDTAHLKQLVERARGAAIAPVNF
jgi:uncharacterized protein YndB with AHSA1/START domain